MTQEWEVRVHHIYREANACIDGLAKQESNQQQVLIIYDTCPTFVYLCYVRDMLGLGTDRLRARRPAVAVDV